MRQFVFVAALVAALGAPGAVPATAQGCAGGMCALPGAATGQPQQQQATPGMGMMGGMGTMGMCHCCRQMAMMQPGTQGGLQPMPGAPGMGGDMGMGSTPRPPAEPAPGPTTPAQ